jgi:hypothetical protein
MRIRNFLKGDALWEKYVPTPESLAVDRLICPPSLLEREGKPYSDCTMIRVWAASGVPYIKVRRELPLIPGLEEAERYVGHVLHEEDSTEDDPMVQSTPIILSVDRDCLEHLIGVPFTPLKVDAEEVIRQSWALVTMRQGWAQPVRRGKRESAPLPWQYLLHPCDYERITTINNFAFWLALGFRLPEDLYNRPTP